MRAADAVARRSSSEVSHPATMRLQPGVLPLRVRDEDGCILRTFVSPDLCQYNRRVSRVLKECQPHTETFKGMPATIELYLPLRG